MRVEDLDRSRVRPGIEERQLADLRAIGLDWDRPVVRQSERMGLYEEAVARLDDEGLLYPCYCTRKEIRAAVSAPHGIPAADRYPGTCRELTGAERAERKPQDGRPRCGCGPRARGSLSRTAFWGARKARWTISSSGATTGRRRTSSQWSWTTRTRALRRWCAARTSRTRRRARSSWPCCSPAGPRYAHVPLVLGPDGRASRNAMGPSRSRTALRKGRTGRVAGVDGPLFGTGRTREKPTVEDLLARFDPDRLPRSRPNGTPAPERPVVSCPSVALTVEEETAWTLPG
jgi:glutamyl-tRNA synthetase